MLKPRKVALLIETSSFYSRELLHGIRGFMREHGAWSIDLPDPAGGGIVPAWLKHWKGDGVIARILTREVAAAVVRLKVPAIDISAARLVPRLPWVESDNDAVARLAFEHFSERGFTNFAFYGEERYSWSRWRREGFVRRVSEAGYQCAVFERPQSSATPKAATDTAAVEKWVRALPKPAAVLASYDYRGFELLEICRRNQIAVPEQVAVLGVNNDELLCDLADPPLSSVITNARQAGYEAASLLQQAMAGTKLSKRGKLVAPLGVETRQSTDLIAVADPHVSQALRLIRERACHGLTTADLLKQTSFSRRIFDSRFRKLLGRTPHEQILWTKIARAKNLLAQTDLSVAQIAERSGFNHPEYMSVAFKRSTGQWPSEFRGRPAGGLTRQATSNGAR
jgi:LacI family transcriptional regulator